MALLLPAIPLLVRQSSLGKQVADEVPDEIIDDEKELSLLPTKLGRSISDGFDNLLGSERPASLLKNPKKDDSVQPDSVVPPPPPHLTRQMSEHHISVFKSGLRQLMYVFIVGATVRLVHAWYTYFESSGVFPASGVLEYLKEANPSQFLVVIHVSLCCVWTALLFYQFWNGLRDRRKQTSSHAFIGYLACGIGGVAAVTGWSAVWSLRVPSFVLPFIKVQLIFGAPSFFTEAVWGVLAITRSRDWRRHRQHMTLAMIGTLADAGNGFSISVSRWLFQGTPYQQWGQDVGVLLLNVVSILPFLVPQIGPHFDFFVAINWGMLRRNFSQTFTLWHYASIVTVVGATLLLISNLVGLCYLVSIRPWAQY
mmetsp:Transcript_6308/g.11961  ORF Transcript_6308/g.11961 Transcript_6308/m.11961 type:complete len:367 (+) Transcript_6308:41-1141(+)